MRNSKDVRPGMAADAAAALSPRRVLRTLLSAAAIVMLSIPAANGAAAFKVLKNFSANAGRPEGSLLEISEGIDPVFYGTAVEEGEFGSVFRVTSRADGGHLLTTLHAFDGLDGNYPSSAPVQGIDGDLYGTTETGGQYDHGTVYRVSKDGAIFSVVHDFSAGDDGLLPHALLLGSDGNFYGTTHGGNLADGTVFRVSPDGSDFATLHTFSGSDGSHPWGALIEIDGMLYGTTIQGGLANSGTVFRISSEGNGFETLHSFVAAIDGFYLLGGVIQGANGDLFGTTAFSGPFNNGTIFKIATNGGDFAVLHSFSGSSGDGATPADSLVQASNGYFYGTTSQGGPTNSGTVFRISANGAEYTVLHSFDDGDGSSPDAALIQGSDGALYGTASGGGPCMAGTIFRLALDGSEIQLLETFGNGVEPEGGLIRGSDGRLYGTTVAGFTCSFGVVFRMDADGGAYTRLHTFNGTDGMEPFGNLTQGPDGTLYGTTGNAGDSACGNVFQISPDGSGFSSLYTFTGADGCHPRAGLVRTPEGDFFGTTVEGGGSALGTVFRLYKDGENWSVDTLHSFDGPNGANPLSALTIGTDGYLYGTTFSGGGGYGTVFRISTGGAFTSLYSLGSSDGHHPRGRLTEGEAGWFYGTASDGGPYGSGTLFKIYKDGTGITTLHGFNYDDGVQPIGGLVRDASGNFYGTTNEGSDVGYGTVFMLDADETTFTTLHSFAGRPDDGEYPAADLLLADGTLYGTTEYGGTGEGGWGTVFRVQPGVSAPHVSISAGGPTTVCEGESVLLTATPSGGSGTYPGYQWYGGGYPIGGATSATYSAEDSGEYSATVTDSSFDTSVKSESVAVTIRPLPAATINPNGTRVICAGSSVDLTASAGSSWLWSTGATTPSITVDTPGDYTVTVTDANGCSATSEPTTVTSVSAPAAIVSGGGTICTRGSATIQAALSGGTPPWSIRWSDGVEQLNIASSPATRTVTPRATTTYTLTAVWDGYCDSGTLDGSAMVAVADRPKAVLKGSAAICPGGSATLTVELTGTGPWNLTWSDGWPQTGITSSPAVRIVSPSVDTIYSISTVSDAGCSPGSARGSARIKIDSIPSASITAPSSVCASSTGNAASVPNAKGGATYAWTVDNGTITSGQGSRNIQFTAGPSGSVVLHVTVSNSGGCSTTSDLTVAIDTGC